MIEVDNGYENCTMMAFNGLPKCKLFLLITRLIKKATIMNILTKIVKSYIDQ